MVYISADYTESIVAVGKNSAASIDNSSDVCLMSDLFENIFKFILFLDDI
jgi:electron transfer flavoprotein alpha subunit